MHYKCRRCMCCMYMYISSLSIMHFFSFTSIFFSTMEYGLHNKFHYYPHGGHSSPTFFFLFTWSKIRDFLLCMLQFIYLSFWVKNTRSHLFSKFINVSILPLTFFYLIYTFIFVRTNILLTLFYVHVCYLDLEIIL